MTGPGSAPSRTVHTSKPPATPYRDGNMKRKCKKRVFTVKDSRDAVMLCGVTVDMADIMRTQKDALEAVVRTLLGHRQRRREVERRIDVWRRKWRVIKDRDRKQWEREHGKG